MFFIKKILNKIESKRGTKKPVFLLLVLAKDILWVFVFYIPYNILKFFQIIQQRLIFHIYTYFDRYQENINTYYKISFCITCMNRLGHLKKTLKKNIKNNAKYPNLEFVLLDYNSSDGLEKWIFKNFKKELVADRLIYFRTDEPKYFHMARAKNISHVLAHGDIVCNLDADNYTGKDFAFYINATLQSSTDIIGLHQKHTKHIPLHIGDCGGRIFLTKDNFLKLGGYNENFIGWGYEDIEFKARAAVLGLRKEEIPRSFLGAITHSNRLREKNLEVTLKNSNQNNSDILEKVMQGGVFSVANEPIDFSQIKRIK